MERYLIRDRENFMGQAGFNLEMQLATYFIVLVGEGAANDCCLLGFSKGSKPQHNHL